jgi:hexosaminidase
MQTIQRIAGVLVMTLATIASAQDVVPKPQEITKGDDAPFVLSNKTRITIVDESMRPVAEYLAAKIAPATGYDLQIVMEQPAAGDIQLTNLYAEQKLGEEGYSLNCGKPGVVISAPKLAGLFYGAQTLRQLLPAQIESKTKVADVQWTAPCVTIRDWPRFKYRGFMLDSGRHIQSIDYIKRQIDLMSLYKLNRFHWHLSEDQGWRIEIKKYPKLTEVGAWRSETMGDGKRYGGFFTQDQARDIVKYAADRFITVIPEIDMPGHENAALASYPNMGCTGGPYQVRTKWGIEKDVLCAGNPETYDFVKGVLDEICDIFPSEVIHIGGDEVPRDRWHDCAKCQEMMKKNGIKNEDELQSYFTHYVAEYLATKGRRIQGWNEIMKGGDLPTTAIVHVWNNDNDTTAAAKSGRDVVYSRTSFCYFDYPWERVPMRKAYACEPIPSELSADDAKHILGIQACLWTEHRPDDKSCDQVTWPRLCATAEAAWTDADKRDYSDFLSRMTSSQYQRLGLTGLAASEDDGAEKVTKDLAQRGAVEERAK